jgi:hypothetical protein
MNHGVVELIGFPGMYIEGPSRYLAEE